MGSNLNGPAKLSRIVDESMRRFFRRGHSLNQLTPLCFVKITSIRLRSLRRDVMTPTPALIGYFIAKLLNFGASLSHRAEASREGWLCRNTSLDFK